MEGTPGGLRPMEMSDDEDSSSNEPSLPRLPQHQPQPQQVPWRFSPVSPMGVKTPQIPLKSPNEPPKERSRRRLDFGGLPSLEGLRKPVNPVTDPDAVVIPTLFQRKSQQQQQQQPQRTGAAKANVEAFQVWLDTYEEARTRFLGIPHVIVRMPTVYAYQEEGAVPRYHGVNIFNEGITFDRDQMPPHVRANLVVSGSLGLLGGDRGVKVRPVAFEFRRPLSYSDPHFVAGIDDEDMALFPLARGPFAPEWTLFRIVTRPDDTGTLHWHLVETEGTQLARNFFGEASNVTRFGVVFLEPGMLVRSYQFTRQPEHPDDH